MSYVVARKGTLQILSSRHRSAASARFHAGRVLARTYDPSTLVVLGAATAKDRDAGYEACMFCIECGEVDEHGGHDEELAVVVDLVADRLGAVVSDECLVGLLGKLAPLTMFDAGRPRRTFAPSRGYNGWSGEERHRLGDDQERLLRLHPQRRVKTCQACGVSVGVVQHLERYDRPFEIIGLCVRCHVAVHERFDHPGGWERHVARVADGWTYPPATHWGSVAARMMRTDRDFTRARRGPSRGPGILDEIATGKWLRCGPAFAGECTLFATDAAAGLR